MFDNTLTQNKTAFLPTGLWAQKWEFLWLCGLVLSFAYERPLAVLTSYDRVNPRLFDLFFVIGLFLVFRKHRQPIQCPPVFIIWKRLVLWFSFCAVTWAVLFLPWEYGKFSIFFAAKYIIGALAVYMALQIPITQQQKTLLMKVAVAGGVFVALYCIPEYLSDKTTIQLTEEKEITVEQGSILGPLGSTYFHIAQYQTLSFCLAIMLIPTARNYLGRIGWAITALFISWPLLFCGSRAAVGLLVFSIIALIVIQRNIRRIMLIISPLIILAILSTKIESVPTIFESTRTAQRFEGMTGTENSIISRLLLFKDFDISEYRWHGISVPLIGAGFYVAPVYENDTPFYRVDYGFHNIYLFPLEQAGIIGIILFLLFLTITVKGLNRIRRSTVTTDKVLACAMLSFIIAVLIVGVTGQIFWLGFGTVNFNTYIVLMLSIAVMPDTLQQNKEQITQ